MTRDIFRIGALLLMIACCAGCVGTNRAFGQAGSILVTYYAPAWGPNTNGEEVVYFLKQVSLETAAAGQDRIYLCSIKPDGSERQEIAQLWKGKDEQAFEGYPTAVTMEINTATKRAAIGVEKGERGGIFVVKLDGTDLKPILPKEWKQNRPTNASYPTWSPDGQWIAFVEWRFEKGYDFREIVKCHPDGTEYTSLTHRDAYKINVQPAWSPTTNLIAYVHYPNYYPGGRYLWLMESDGGNKRITKVWGDYPRWSPDGKLILQSGAAVVDPATGKRIKVWDGPWIYPKWGKNGFISVGPHDISIADVEGKASHQLLKNASRRGSGANVEKEGFRW